MLLVRTFELKHMYMCLPVRTVFLARCLTCTSRRALEAAMFVGFHTARSFWTIASHGRPNHGCSSSELLQKRDLETHPPGTLSCLNKRARQSGRIRRAFLLDAVLVILFPGLPFVARWKRRQGAFLSQKLFIPWQL